MNYIIHTSNGGFQHFIWLCLTFVRPDKRGIDYCIETPWHFKEHCYLKSMTGWWPHDVLRCLYYLLDFCNTVCNLIKAIAPAYSQINCKRDWICLTNFIMCKYVYLTEWWIPIVFKLRFIRFIFVYVKCSVFFIM